jgi:hypothetical protein
MDFEERKNKAERVFRIVKAIHRDVDLGNFQGVKKWEGHAAIVQTSTGTIRITGEAITDLDHHHEVPNYTKTLIESFKPDQEEKK